MAHCSLVRYLVRRAEAASSSWLKPAAEWSTWRDPTTAPTAHDEAFWAALIPIPLENPPGQLLLGGAATPLQIRAPSSDDRDAHPARESLQTDAPNLEAIRPFLTPLLTDPAERWRASLIEQRLKRDDPSTLPAEPRPAIDDPALEALATQNEDRWRHALQRLADADPDAAARLVSELTAVAEITPGVRAPAWIINPTDQSLFLEGLLAPAASPRDLVALAHDWVNRQPRAVAWITDDAGHPIPGSDSVIVSAAIVERSGRPGMASMSAASPPARSIGAPAPAPPFKPTVLSGPVNTASPPRALRISLDGWSTVLPIAAGGLPAQPPGAILGPLFEDWRLDSWITGAPRIPPVELRTVALVQKSPDSAGWQVYIECRTPASSGDPEAPLSPEENYDFVRLFLGPTAAPVAILRIDSRAGAVNELQQAQPAPQAAIHLESDRWTAVLPIPHSAIEPGGALRIAIERRRGNHRSAWPRPMLPWQNRPGRIALNLSAWTDPAIAR